MTVDTATVAGVWTGVAVSLGSAVFVYGRLTERVKGQGDRIGRVETKVDDHETRLSHLEGKVHVR